MRAASLSAASSLAIVSTLLLAMASSARAVITTIEPDDYKALGAIPMLSRVGPGVNTPADPALSVLALPQSYGPASTGTHVFYVGTDGGSTSESNRYLRADFTQPTDFVSIDMIGTDDQNTGGILRAYNAGGVQVASYQTTTVGRGAIEAAMVTRPSADIAYVTAGGLAGHNQLLDNLQYNVVPEPATIWLAVTALLAIAGRWMKR